MDNLIYLIFYFIETLIKAKHILSEFYIVKKIKFPYPNFILSEALHG
jgi:hypothetical protein